MGQSWALLTRIYTINMTFFESTKIQYIPERYKCQKTMKQKRRVHVRDRNATFDSCHRQFVTRACSDVTSIELPTLYENLR